MLASKNIVMFLMKQNFNNPLKLNLRKLQCKSRGIVILALGNIMEKEYAIWNCNEYGQT